MENKEVENVTYKTYIKSGMTMSLEDIGSIRTLTYDETEELARTGDLKSDNKFKKRKLAWT